MTPAWHSYLPNDQVIERAALMARYFDRAWPHAPVGTLSGKTLKGIFDMLPSSTNKETFPTRDFDGTGHIGGSEDLEGFQLIWQIDYDGQIDIRLFDSRINSFDAILHLQTNPDLLVYRVSYHTQHLRSSHVRLAGGPLNLLHPANLGQSRALIKIGERNDDRMRILEARKKAFDPNYQYGEQSQTDRS